MKKLAGIGLLILLSVLSYGQEISSYNFNVNIDVTSRKVAVKGSVEIDFKSHDSISLVLWKNTNIKSIRFNMDEVPYRFDTISPSPVIYIPNGRSLVLHKPAKSKERETIFFDYESDMQNLNGWAKSFSDNWIELNYYSAWFPLNSNSRSFKSKFKITIDKRFQVTGSGLIRKVKDHWEMKQPWSAFDNVIIASKSLKSKTLNEGKVYVETVYSDFSESDADSVISECRYVFDLYKRLFGSKENTYLKFVIAPFEQGGGYSRKSFVSMRTKHYGFYTRVGIGHEMAHFWWSNAVTTTWEDWLNEAFAEYSMLIYFRERSGPDIFNKQIDEYRTRTLNSPPIWGISRNAPESYTVLYEKGALILFELEQRIGKDQFFSFLKEVSDRKIKTTAEFLELMESKFSKEMRQWFESLIKSA